MFPLLAFALAQALSTPPPVPAAPGLVFAFEARVELGQIIELGQVAAAGAASSQSSVARFEGSGLKGRVLNSGADWQIVRADGFTEIDTRYALETDKGQVIYVQNAGCDTPPRTYCRRLAAGETVDPNLVYFPHGCQLRNVRARTSVADALNLRRHRRTASDPRHRPLLEAALSADGTTRPRRFVVAASASALAAITAVTLTAQSAQSSGALTGGPGAAAARPFRI